MCKILALWVVFLTGVWSSPAHAQVTPVQTPGEQIVFVIGFTGKTSDWQPFVDKLTGWFDLYQVQQRPVMKITPAIPQGFSHKPADCFHIAGGLFRSVCKNGLRVEYAKFAFHIFAEKCRKFGLVNIV